ncbi:MAG: peptidylprolyl isomerase [Saprospiraceae bacterium]
MTVLNKWGLGAVLLVFGWPIWSVWISCTLPDNEASGEAGELIDLDFSDKNLQKIYDWRDRGLIDSLIQTLRDGSATQRYTAALSFAPGDSAAIPALASALRDRVPQVRLAAAFALGQIGHPDAEPVLTQAFRSDDSLSEYQLFNALILEAIGKCGNPRTLDLIAGVTTYESFDTMLLIGQCRSIFQFGNRKVFSPNAAQVMTKYAAGEAFPVQARILAAQYLARYAEVKPDSAQARLLVNAFIRAQNTPFLQAPLAAVLGKVGAPEAFSILARNIRRSQDWRVTCEIIRAMGAFEYDTARWLVAPLLRDTNAHVAYEAASFFLNNGQLRDGDYYLRLAREHADIHWRARIALWAAANRYARGEKREFASYSIREIYSQATNPYERAACISAVAEYPWQYKWIYEKALNDIHPAVKTAAAHALSRLCRLPDFYRVYGEYANDVRGSLYRQARNLMATGNPGIIAGLSPGLRSEVLNFRTRRDTALMDDLANLRRNLSPIRDYEALLALDSVVAYFAGQPYPQPHSPSWNTPIKWENLRALNDKKEIVIKTTQGEIVLEIRPEWAPATTAAFIEAINTGVLNGKTFHRIVPGHVTQGGCPRGDGYGALDYTLYTETGLKWYDDAGYVGMARADARNTESVQFFITHAPRPHLDGRYAIFTKVKKGLNVALNLTPGDQIERIFIK